MWKSWFVILKISNVLRISEQSCGLADFWNGLTVIKRCRMYMDAHMCMVDVPTTRSLNPDRLGIT